MSWETDTEVAGELLSEVAGRLCYLSFARPRPGGNRVYLDHIKEVGHGSVLEHAVWNFICVGCSRSLTHELVRHRAGTGFSQLSQRYVDESIAEYVEPDCIANDSELHRLWVDAVADSHKAYMKLTEKLLKVWKGGDFKGGLRRFRRAIVRKMPPWQSPNYFRVGVHDPSFERQTPFTI